MNNKEEYHSLSKSIKVLMSITIVTLLIYIIYSYYDPKIIFLFKAWILPYILIDLLIQIVNGIIILINKSNKKILNIFEVLLEIIYFLYTTFLTNMFKYTILINSNEIFANIIIILFECINITLLILIIKSVIKKK